MSQEREYRARYLKEERKRPRKEMERKASYNEECDECDDDNDYGSEGELEYIARNERKA